MLGPANRSKGPHGTLMERRPHDHHDVNGPAPGAGGRPGEATERADSAREHEEPDEGRSAERADRADRFTWSAPVAILYDPLRDGPERR